MSDGTGMPNKAVRLPLDLLARLDAHVATRKAREPGLKYTRADAIRQLLYRMLDLVDADER